MRSTTVQKNQSKNRCILGSGKITNLPKFQTFKLFTVHYGFFIFAEPKIE
jgi:hypothetical protein